MRKRFYLGWSHTGGMKVERVEHTVSLLNDGKVLVTGGTDPKGILHSAESCESST